jgi:uncharacterized protein (DUF2336 family)
VPDLLEEPESSSNSIIEELESAVSGGTSQSRLAALFHATDLLIAGRYSADQIWIFGEIIGLLAAEIEVTARARLAKLLATSANAPVKVINKLAFDDSIDVSGVVLRESRHLDDQTLIKTAECKSQDHLLAISQRKSLSQQVTDVLVTRGSQDVVRSVAKNQGASISETGFWHMVSRSENDSILTEIVGMRKDIPRHCFQQLIAKACDEVKERLTAANAEARSEVQQVVSDVTGVLQSKFGPASKDYFAAKRLVGGLHRRGELNKEKVHELAKSHKFEEVTIALSLLQQMPVDVIERALLDERRDMILILAKATDLSWSATKSLLFLRGPGVSISQVDLDDAMRRFSQLGVATAVQVLTFYRSRRQNPAEAPAAAGLPLLHRV